MKRPWRCYKNLSKNSSAMAMLRLTVSDVLRCYPLKFEFRGIFVLIEALNERLRSHHRKLIKQTDSQGSLRQSGAGEAFSRTRT